MSIAALLIGASSAAGFIVPVAPPPLRAASRYAAAAIAPLAQPLAARPTLVRSAAAPTMGLFGLGAPELAVIGAVALLILGPDQVKKLAKDIGKVSAELKQVRAAPLPPCRPSAPQPKHPARTRPQTSPPPRTARAGAGGVQQGHVCGPGRAG